MKRRERITFQEKTTTYNEVNEPVETWGDLSDTPTMWAKAMPRTGNEDFRNNQEGGFQRYDFNILHRDDLDVQMRISWDGRLWDIVAIETLHKEPRNKELLITAEWKQGQFN